MIINKFISTLRYLITVKPEPGAGDHCPSPIFGRSVNPIPIGGEPIIPTYYYLHLQIVSPSAITESASRVEIHLNQFCFVPTFIVEIKIT